MAEFLIKDEELTNIKGKVVIVTGMDVPFVFPSIVVVMSGSS
jgi:hypothetical protein